MAKKNLYAEDDIKTLNLDKEVEDVLINNKITTVGQVWEMNRKSLKDLGFKDNEIKQITIKLQLLGLDLNKRIYS